MQRPDPPREVDLTAPLFAIGADRNECTAVEREVIELFDDLRSRLIRYLLSFSPPVSDSEDIIQEAFLALFQHLQNGKSRQNLRGWLFRVVHNLALKKRRAQRNAKNVPESSAAAEGFLIDSAPNPEDQFTIKQKHGLLMAVVRALPEHDRCCLQLRAEGLRYREIAEVLGISLGSVSACLERSLARIVSACER